ncbi:MAG TPA: DUF2325 domain-containing protein [Bacillota bacterium]|nr:DUF2325 domain-containing protein [Bacillota bacterium]
MKVLIVGADRLGDIPACLQQRGVKEVIHWSGRAKGQRKWELPHNLSGAIIFYDFIAHPLMHKLKRELKQRHVPITYARRGQSCLASLNLGA